MEEDFLNNELINRFEQMLEKKQSLFFDTEEFYEIIAFYLDVGDLPFAKKALDYGLDIYPSNTDLLIKKLEYLLAVNKLKEAGRLIQDLKEVGGSDEDYLISVALFWSLRGNPSLSIKFYLKALEIGEDKAYIYNCIGNEYLNLNEVGKALDSFKSALELEPDDEFSFFSIIHCYEELNRHKECIDFINEYIDMKPYSEVAWSQLGHMYLELEDFENAHRAFDYVTIINPKGILAYIDKAGCLEKMDDYEGAIKVYEETLELDDSAAFTYLNIGNCYRRLGKPYKALKAYHQSLREDPQLAANWAAASDLYESIGNYEEALYYLNRALSFDNENIDFLKRRAYLYIQLVQFEESVLDYYKLVKLEPNNYYNWLGLTETLITIGDYKKAIESVNEGLKHFNRAELFYQLSNCYYLLGNEEEGSNAFKKAAELNASLQSEIFKKYPILENKISQSAAKIKKIRKK